jgi:membrane protease YdiL (CAAX protease family)
MRATFTFAVLTYIVSWLLWIASAAISRWDLSQPSGLVALSGPLYLLGVFAPALVALVLTVRADGRAAVASLLHRTLVWSVGARWYLFAVGYFAAIKLAVAIVHHVITNEWPGFSQTPWFVMLLAIVVSAPVQAGEEIGWRGYLLPRLSTRVGLPVASIMVGAIWGCWHMPFFLIAGTDKSGQSFPAYVLGVMALSVAMAWLYWRTQGSLLLTMLMHAAVNNTNLVPTPLSTSANPFVLRASLVEWLTVALLWLCAVFFLVAMRGPDRVLDGCGMGRLTVAEAPGCARRFML